MLIPVRMPLSWSLGPQHRDIETFEKCSILFRSKSKIPPNGRGKARILTGGIPLSISRIRIRV